MQYICSADEMQAIDAYSIQEIGIPGIVLMEKASLALEDEIIRRFPDPVPVLIITEKGNNGGDGLALGRLLMARGYPVNFYEIGAVKRATESYMIQRNILDQLGGHFVDELPSEGADIIVDAIFGVGLKREVGGIHREIIERVNKMDAFRVAVDVPSGVDASSGRILGCSFKADLTVTFGFNKLGLILYPGADQAGQVLVRDIGFPLESVLHVLPRTLTYSPEDLTLLPGRRSWSNKGSYGKVLLIAGSCNMAGAAYLSALAAYRTGCGLVRIFTCEQNRVILQSLIPEAIMTTWTSHQDMERLLPEAISWADVIGIGPGIGQGEMAGQLLHTVLSCGKVPLVIDADGINSLAKMDVLSHAGLYQEYSGGMILTPHLKEMERLSHIPVKDIQESLPETAGRFADPGHVFVLKDARTLVSDGTEPTYINQSGNHGMAVGGSGDVLTGIICGLLAQGLSLLEAARLGVYCHGLAGDAAAAEKGCYSMSARDIAESICQVIR
ncbi:MAG: NAD(P)H-hydrate dehydratase [Eubacterium sp.]|nr:NAD(P)H-hydrate dehydratase [Eubacterium sp.]